MLTFKVCVRLFSGIFKARMLKLGIHMDNELLYCGIENRTPYSYSSFCLSIFLSFKAKFESQFSLELCKLESSSMICICRMSGIEIQGHGSYFSIFYPFLAHLSTKCSW